MSTKPTSAELARAQLLRVDTLRAAINLANPLLVSGRNAAGEPIGVAPSIAAAVAADLGVALELVPYSSPAAIADRVGADEWDIALIGDDPSRAESIAFSPAYVEIAASYLVAENSTVVEAKQVDAPATRIIAVDRSAYDLWLRSNLQHSELVHVPDDGAGLALFRREPGYVLAGLRPTLAAHRAQLPETRILSGHFMTVKQAIGTQKANQDGAKYLRQFVEEAIASGLVLTLLRDFGVDSLISVAQSN